MLQGLISTKKITDGVTAFDLVLQAKGNVECLKELIAAGADINKEDNDGGTALYSAANQGHVECLKELIAAGTDVNKEDNSFDGLPDSHLNVEVIAASTKKIKGKQL